MKTCALLIAVGLICIPILADEPDTQSSAVDDIITMHTVGVRPSTMVAYVRNIEQPPLINAEDIVRMQEKRVPGEVMTALILKAQPLRTSVTAAEVVGLHDKKVSEEVVKALLNKSRQAQTAAETASKAKPNQTFLLQMPVRSSVMIIPHTPGVQRYKHSPYYVYPNRYYGPTMSYSAGYGYYCGGGYCW